MFKLIIKQKVLFASCGIDLGTTFSAIATTSNGKPSVLPNVSGATTTASVIAFDKQSNVLVGEPARRQSLVNSSNTFTSVKSLIGKQFQEISKKLDKFPYKLVEDTSGCVKIVCPNAKMDFFSEQLSAYILQSLLNNFQKSMQHDPEGAVITVPAYFNDAQRNSTRNAGLIAGLDVLRLLNEPTAAALAYGYDDGEESLLFIFDAGGGTFDVSLLETGDGVFEVLKTGGDSSLGGDDIDQLILDWIVKGFKKKHDIKLTTSLKTIQRLKEGTERVKQELSSLTNANVNIPFIANSKGKPKHIFLDVNRNTLSAIIAPLILRFKTPVNLILQEANVKPTDIDQVILVGGTTRIPLMIELVSFMLNVEPNISENPDEAVCKGAALQAHMMADGTSDMLLIDSSTLSVGVETLGGINTILIPRNTSLPTSKNETFSTATDNQSSVDINVLQGERELASNCTPIGSFKLTGIKPAPRGIPQIDVSFQIDVNGILKVIATDKGSGCSSDIEIKNTSDKSKEEIDQIIKEASEWAEHDLEKKNLITTKNEASSMIYEVERSMQENKDKYDNETRNNILELIEQLKTDLMSDNPENIKQSTLKLKQFL